jgi:hypothetical protein
LETRREGDRDTGIDNDKPNVRIATIILLEFDTVMPDSRKPQEREVVRREEAEAMSRHITCRRRGSCLSMQVKADREGEGEGEGGSELL